jgi:hypothetical protein
MATSLSYDHAKWNALVQCDPEIEAAANMIQPLGQRWADELAASYLAIGDKSRLVTIVENIQARAAEEVLQAQMAANAAPASAAAPAQTASAVNTNQPFFGRGLKSILIVFFLVLAELVLIGVFAA